MPLSLVEEQRKVLCHTTFCKYLKRKWPFYGPVVEFSVANRELILSPERIEIEVKRYLNIKRGWLGLDELTSVLRKKKELRDVTINEDALFDLLVYVCMTVEDHTKAPTSDAGGGKKCA